MNAWKFLVVLAPVAGLERQFGEIPKKLFEVYNSDDDDQGDIQPEYWKDYASQEELVASLSGILEERASWSPEVMLFGVKGTDEIEIWMTDDWKIMEILIAFSINHPNPSFIHTSLSIARKFRLVFKSIRTQDVFGPTVDEFVQHAEKCTSSRFLPKNIRLIELLGGS